MYNVSTCTARFNTRSSWRAPLPFRASSFSFSSAPQGEGSTAHTVASRLGIGRVGKVRSTRCPKLFGVGQLDETPSCNTAASLAVFPCILDRKQVPSLPELGSHRPTVGTLLRLCTCASARSCLPLGTSAEAGRVIRVSTPRSTAAGTSKRRNCVGDHTSCCPLHVSRGLEAGSGTDMRAAARRNAGVALGISLFCACAYVYTLHAVSGLGGRRAEAELDRAIARYEASEGSDGTSATRE